MFFKKKLKNLRVSSNKTQKDLAELLGITERTIRKYEAGSMQPSTENLIKLANIFNVSIDYLVNEKVTESQLESYVESLSLEELQHLQHYIQQLLQEKQS